MKLIIGVLIFAFASTVSGGWSLRYLAKASNFILAASDATSDSKAPLCKIKGMKYSDLSRRLHILVDEKVATLSKLQQKQALKQSLGCESECTCDIYALVLEPIGTPEAKTRLQQLEAKAAEVQPKQRLECASKFSEFCHSGLLKKISRGDF